MESLIIGAGEVGKSLHKVIGGQIKDTKPIKIGKIDILHICFPYSEHFVQDVRGCQALYNPRYTVIHSTVPIGTTRAVNEFFHDFQYNPTFFSPIRGKHPKLAQSIKTFVKYLSPPNRTVRRYFEEHGIKIKEVKRPDDVEAMKLWCTTQYGWNIVLEKEIYKWCKEHKLDFDLIYTEMNKTYNEGYSKMRMPQFSKYMIGHQEGKIGGHCVMQNCDLLKSPITASIKRFNAKYK